MGTTRQKSSCRNRLQNGPRSLSQVKAGTHSPSPTGSHTTAHTAKHGAFRMGGGITTLGAFCAVRKPCVARCQNGVLCRFGILAGRCSRRTQKAFGTAICAYACRCPEGVAAPLGCVIFCFCRNCGLYALHSELSVRAKQGWYHYPRRAPHVLETLDGRLSKGLICRFLRSGDYLCFQRWNRL